MKINTLYRITPCNDQYPALQRHRHTRYTVSIKNNTLHRSRLYTDQYPALQRHRHTHHTVSIKINILHRSVPCTKHTLYQGWVIRRRRIIRRIVFITYLTVLYKLLRIIRFWALNEFAATSPPELPRSTPRPSRAPQRHFQAL